MDKDSHHNLIKETFKFLNNSDLIEKLEDASDNTDSIKNQTDNKAFLHAMRSVKQSVPDAEDIFKNHLKSCFLGYLKNSDVKLLGRAFHGIMDSFTPSHTRFKNFKSQDTWMHLIGDIVLENKGQYKLKNERVIDIASKTMRRIYEILNPNYSIRGDGNYAIITCEKAKTEEELSQEAVNEWHNEYIQFSADTKNIDMYLEPIYNNPCDVSDRDKRISHFFNEIINYEIAYKEAEVEQAKKYIPY